MKDNPPTGSGPPFHLRTFGTVALARSDGTTVLGTHGNHRRRLALLSVLAAAGERGRSRDQLLLLFWPEATQARAQHSLDQLLYTLRSSVADSMFEGTNPLHLNASVVASDVGAFNTALERNDLDAAVSAYRGPFLDGFYPSDAPEFERWAETERARLAESFAGALGALARRASDAGDSDAAVRWWTALSDADPLSTRNAIGRIRALGAAGDRGAALRYAGRYEALVARELGLPLDPDVAAAIRELRSDRAEASGLSKPAAVVQAAPAADRRPVMKRHARIGGALMATALLSIAVLALAVWPRARAGGAPAPAPRPATRSIAARELYLRGNDPALTRSDSGARASVEYFRQAIALDSTYVAAYAGLARMLMRSSKVGARSAGQRHRQLMLARQAAERAVSLDDSSGDAHAALASVRRNSYDVAGAIQEMRRAAALDPRDARIREWLAQLDVVAGRPAEALAEARQAVALEPLSATANAELARALSAGNRCDDALTRLRSVESVRPLLLRAASIAAQCYTKQGMWAEAIAEERRTLFDQRRGNGLLGFLLARAGRTSEARLLLDTLVAGSRGGLSGAYDIAVVYAGLGVKDSADIWLARSVDDGSLDFEYINTTLDALSPDAAVDALRRRMGIQDR